MAGGWEEEQEQEQEGKTRGAERRRRRESSRTCSSRRRVEDNEADPLRARESVMGLQESKETRTNQCYSKRRSVCRRVA